MWVFDDGNEDELPTVAGTLDTANAVSAELAYRSESLMSSAIEQRDDWLTGDGPLTDRAEYAEGILLSWARAEDLAVHAANLDADKRSKAPAYVDDPDALSDAMARLLADPDVTGAAGTVRRLAPTDCPACGCPLGSAGCPNGEHDEHEQRAAEASGTADGEERCRWCHEPIEPDGVDDDGVPTWSERIDDNTSDALCPERPGGGTHKPV
jgi:hypothetical protein